MDTVKKERDNGGPAFPLPEGSETTAGSEGMTLRDYFAAHAMQRFCTQAEPTRSVHFANLAQDAYSMADAMLEART